MHCEFVASLPQVTNLTGDARGPHMRSARRARAAGPSGSPLPPPRQVDALLDERRRWRSAPNPGRTPFDAGAAPAAAGVAAAAADNAGLGSE